MTDRWTRETLEGARRTRPAMPPPERLPEADAESEPLYERIQRVAAQYPQRRSAILPALRLAQAEHGWLSPQAFEDVAEALGFTPALCKSVASFYDMYRLEPTGRHEICVCTNISCALVGAGDTLREFERELGIHAGETTPDGMFTLRSVECYGGCGWGPVVSVDEIYQEPFPPESVRPLLEGLRTADEPPTPDGEAA